VSSKVRQGAIGDSNEGIGSVTPQMIRQRAEQIAVSDGRTRGQVTPADLDQARSDLLPDIRTGRTHHNLAPVAPSLATDEPVPSTGREADTGQFEAVETDAERLTLEGVEDAVHDAATRSGTETIRIGRQSEPDR